MEKLNNIKIAIVTVHKSDIKELLKTITSVDSQVKKPTKHIIISPNLNYKKINIKKKYRKFIIGKDTSIYNAMNIGLEKTKDFFLLFLNSGDTFCNKQSLEIICKKILPNKCNIFKTYLKYGNTLFMPKKKTFNSNYYCPHPSFIRPPVKKNQILFDEKFKIISDGIWMKRNINKFDFIKHNKFVSIHSLGGVSTKPNFQMLSDNLKISFKQFLKQVFKLIFFFILGEKNYFYLFMRFHFEKK